MPDQPIAPADPAGAQPAANQSSGDTTPAQGEMVPVARLNGALAKIQELTLQIQGFTGQLAAKDATIAQLQGEFSQKDATAQVAAREKDTALQTALGEKTTLEAELKRLRALEQKMKAIQEIGNPALYGIVNDLPDAESYEAQKVIVQRFGEFATGIAKTRETQILAGTTIPGGTPISAATALPTTDADWGAYIEKFPLGSPERAKAMDAWRGQLFK